MSEILDWVSGILLITGALLSLIASIGLLRFPDLLTRLHSGSKPQVLGLFCIMGGFLIRDPGWGNLTTVAVILLFQMLTIPASTHMVGRAAYRTRHLKRSGLYKDELAQVIEAAERLRRLEESKEE